ncbi:hypothetical protein HRJ35_04740 [Shewanella oneidensis MR-1]|uniref:Iron-regulated inner membrane protein n=1 Tax=Shewanella oneidensis (strain ATCC 700550 / JCM 31522 / CIP 106686 / LMG 19005 / NCIMB 14063 / MR-1) TaxID=211586 RepID=Q8EJL5_SHEON|nr:hypothetical protein [Shewanella oneidensis]AAN53530.1 iron-regulated inner membrane protein [Shewanella oneidensis MR-1]MDX5997604.1 hypothetical protein [Shewanella oneidensis]MEE2029339.1 hypothetical protein [Shewanella oneidensis]QKG95372.1 hypothetical protein HRJ35_04740 [Shewanella oneidensis MR-1]
MARLAEQDKLQPDWWTKSLAGLILGFTLALGLVGLFAWFGPGGIDADTKVQFNMWLITPIWLLILSFSFLFKTGLRAIGYLSLLNILTYIVLYAFR